MKKHSVSLNGHRTSISLEEAFWEQLHILAKKKGCALQELITSIDKTREGNLSSALRVYVLKEVLKRPLQ